MGDRVTIVQWPERPGQLTAYDHFLKHFSQQTKWVAFIDLDEFIHPLSEPNIRPLLERANKHSAILLNWMTFGPGQYIDSPEGLVTDAYTMRLTESHPINFHVKTIAKTSDLLGIGGAHIQKLASSPCNAQGITISNDAIGKERCAAPVVINHYYTKSSEDWKKKVATGRATVKDDPEIQRKLEWFDTYKAAAVIEDLRIKHFIPDIRAILGEA